MNSHRKWLNISDMFDTSWSSIRNRTMNIFVIYSEKPKQTRPKSMIMCSTDAPQKDYENKIYIMCMACTPKSKQQQVSWFMKLRISRSQIYAQHFHFIYFSMAHFPWHPFSYRQSIRGDYQKNWSPRHCKLKCSDENFVFVFIIDGNLYHRNVYRCETWVDWIRIEISNLIAKIFLDSQAKFTVTEERSTCIIHWIK